MGTGSNRNVVGLDAVISLFSSFSPIVVKHCTFSLGAMNEAEVLVHVLEGIMNAERYSICSTYAPLQMTSISRKALCISAGQCKTRYCSYFTTAWLRSRRVRMLNWPACNPDLSPIENIWCIIKQKYVKDDHELFSRWKPVSGNNGTKFQHSINSYPRCPDVFKLF